MASDFHSHLRELGNVVPGQHTRAVPIRRIFHEAGCHKKRPRYLILAKERGCDSEDALPPVIESDGKITQLTAPTCDCGCGHESKSVPNSKLDMTAKARWRAVVDAQISLSHRM